MKHLKIFENFLSHQKDGYMKVPSDFDDAINMGMDRAKSHKKVYYSNNANQMKIDLFYGIKYEIKRYLEDVEYNRIERTQEEYEKIINSELYSDDKTGILRKFSGGLYNNIEEENIGEVKNILWELINKYIPYNEVDYYYKYKLRDKLTNLLGEFIDKIREEGLFVEKEN